MVAPDDATALRADIQSLKDLMAKQDATGDQIREAVNQLQQKSIKTFEVAYKTKQQGQAQQQQQSAADDKPNDGKTVDAEFSEKKWDLHWTQPLTQPGAFLIM